MVDQNGIVEAGIKKRAVRGKPLLRQYHALISANTAKPQ
jgi:hypothetical protein